MKFTRRRFISTLSMGSALIMLPTIHTLSNSLIKGDKKKLGIALAGLGNYSTHQLAPALLETSNCYLSGIVTGTPAKAEKWKNQYKIPDGNIYNYENFDRIADNKSIDVVYIVLPNSMHYEFTVRAARAGKHVFCEKPMALTVKECIEMIDVCKNTGVRLFIGYRLHSDPYHEAAMKFRSEDVGKIKFVESEFGFRIGNPDQWRLKKSLAGGGAMMDLGIYAIQGARYSVGKEPVSVIAHEYKTDPEKFREVDETIIWQMEFPDYIVSNSFTSYASQANRLFISAENGWFELRPAFSYNSLKGNTNKGVLEFPHINQQAAQMDNFSKCILDGTNSDSDGEEGLKDLKVIEAIYNSIERGMKVKI